jgi:hypothetical protein
MPKNELIMMGGDLDGLTMNANDDTFQWPIVITFEMMADDGTTPFGADEIPSGVVRVRKVRYSIINSGEAPGNGDAFAQYMHDQTWEDTYDTNTYVNDPTDPFHPDNTSS